jgi:hypothetical protein
MTARLYVTLKRHVKADKKNRFAPRRLLVAFQEHIRQPEDRLSRLTLRVCLF